MRPAHRSAFTRVVCDPHPVLTIEETHALRAFSEVRAMSEISTAVGLAGGARPDRSDRAGA
jgi:hypothetical protein